MSDKMIKYIETNNICCSIGEASNLLFLTMALDKEDEARIWDIHVELDKIFEKYEKRREELRNEINDMLDKVEQ